MSISMETPQNIPNFQFPPGVRFHPSDEELIVNYLLNKVNSRPLPAPVVGEIELYNHNPWELPRKAPFGEEEWYFFSPRERKYPKGARPNRTAASGYWKATGTDKVITSSSGGRVGVKKALVFYVGKPPSGIKTEWVMIEYRIPDTMIKPQRSNGSMRLDDWVLCRIRQKGNMPNNIWDNQPSPNNPLGNLPNINDLPAISADPPSEACTNYFLPKDCHLLDKLLAAQQLPLQVASASRATSQGSNVGQPCNATYDLGSSMHRQVANSYFHGAFTRQGKPNNENGYGNFSQSASTMPMMYRSENFAAVSMPMPNNASFYTRHEPQGLFNLNLSSTMTNLQGADVLPFTKRLQQ